jgi:hypothetical protein
MKKLIIAAGLLLASQALIAQTETPKKKREPAYGDFVYVSSGMDTLYLSLESPISEMTRLAWAADPKWTGSNPTIIMIPQSEIDRKKHNKNK